MQWLDQLPFADNRVVQMGFLAACGIAALILLAILYRLVFAHRLRVPGGRTRQPRLGLVDAFSLDGQRQLVLVRRDNVEHLVMIGGPNDVLVESQINRALTPARENNQASPLLAPSASGRRTDTPLAAAPVVAEAPPPSKVAAPAAAPAPAAPKAPAPVSAPAGPKAPAPVPVPAAPKPPAPALATATVPAPAAAPAPAAKPIEPEPAARPASVSFPAAQSPEPVRPEPASPPPPPRPAPARPTMPPPIVPASGSASRASMTRLTEKVAPRPSPISGNPPAASAAAPSPARPENEEPGAAAVAAEPRARPPAATVAAASPASAPARPAGKTPPFEGGQKIGEVRPLGDKPNAASSVKPSTKVDDPFADLDSLEAEMARLLGREK
jgi:flagellar protein FliO/FliZ